MHPDRCSSKLGRLTLMDEDDVTDTTLILVIDVNGLVIMLVLMTVFWDVWMMSNRGCADADQSSAMVSRSLFLCRTLRQLTIVMHWLGRAAFRQMATGACPRPLIKEDPWWIMLRVEMMSSAEARISPFAIPRRREHRMELKGIRIMSKAMKCRDAARRNSIRNTTYCSSPWCQERCNAIMKESRPISLPMVMLSPARGHGARTSNALQRQQRPRFWGPQQSPLQRRPRRPYFYQEIMPVTLMWSGARSSAPPAVQQRRWRTQGMCMGGTWGAKTTESPTTCPTEPVAGAHEKGAECTPR